MDGILSYKGDEMKTKIRFMVECEVDYDIFWDKDTLIQIMKETLMGVNYHSLDGGIDVVSVELGEGGKK